MNAAMEPGDYVLSGESETVPSWREQDPVRVATCSRSPFPLLFTSIKIADKLDEDFLEDIALNQAIKAAEDGENAEGEISLDDLIKEPVLQRTRKRPKREV